MTDVNEVTPACWPELDCELKDLGQENLHWLLEHWQQYQPESPQAKQRRENAIGDIQGQFQLAERQAPIFANLRSADYFAHGLSVFGMTPSSTIGSGVVEEAKEGAILVRPYGSSSLDARMFSINSLDIMLLSEAAYFLTHPDYLKIWRAVSAAPIA